MLNISADEDDDANRAAGNHYADVAPAAGAAPRKERSRAGAAQLRGEAVPATAPSSPVGVTKTTPEDAARALVNRARVAESVDDGHALLDAWQRDMALIETLRGTKPWEALERELGAGLRRSLGVDPAAAFVAALRASDPQQVTVLQQHWEGKWADTLAAMQQEAPATYALLRRHVAGPDRARPRPFGRRAKACAGMTSEARTEAMGRPPYPAFEAHLRDETGEVASDPITTPLAFAHPTRTSGTRPTRTPAQHSPGTTPRRWARSCRTR